jgi:RNA exonuclease 4
MSTKDNVGAKTKKKGQKPSQNWQLLLAKGSSSSVDAEKKRKRPTSAGEEGNLEKKKPKGVSGRGSGGSSGARALDNLPAPSHYVGLDCEMVGLGPSGRQSALARACLVDYQGDVLYDRFVRPKGFVTDFRTKYSGVRSGNLRKGEACTFEECQQEVADLIKGKVLVGHALKNDLTVLMLGHPHTHIRDTASYRPLMKCRKVGDKEKFRPNALRNLAKERLGIIIQDGEHDPGVDARSAMMLYRECRVDWEKGLSEQAKKAYVPSSKHKKKGHESGKEGTKSSVLLSTEKRSTNVAKEHKSSPKRLRSLEDIEFSRAK